jgi:hypothetical protein
MSFAPSARGLADSEMSTRPPPCTDRRIWRGLDTKPPTDGEFFVGRDAYFADPEGNYWEIACAPLDNPVVAAARRAVRVEQ